MNDLLPADSPAWQYVEATVSDVLSRYGFSEIRFPIVESTDLFKRGIGEATDIIEKEMYTFDDRNGDSLSMRPEGTASCVRACEQHGLLYNQTQRLWYQGPMFRYERPQKGRLRQFHQIGVELIGEAGPLADIEVIAQQLKARATMFLSQENLHPFADRASRGGRLPTRPVAGGLGNRRGAGRCPRRRHLPDGPFRAARSRLSGRYR